MTDGNYWEKSTEPQGLERAIECYQAAYDQLIALLPKVSGDSADLLRRLGLARMNEANAWMKRSVNTEPPTCIQKATTAYEAAIAWFERARAIDGSASSDSFLRDQNTSGAAWMNLGQALHARGDLEGVERALGAFEQALKYLNPLPLSESPWYSLNLAGVEMNRANALLSHVGFLTASKPSADQFAEDKRVLDDLLAARASASRALALLRDNEKTSPAAAELGLKARRALCDALGELLPRTDHLRLDNEANRQLIALSDEAADIAESGLSLYQIWETSVPAFEPLALRFYQFGATIYRIHQPHFLAEFLIENGDLTSETWRDIARQAVALAQRDLGQIRHFSIGDRDSERRLETARALVDLEKTLALPSS